MWETFHYFGSLEQAVAGAIKAGVVAVDSNGCAEIVAALGSALSDGNLTVQELDAAVTRQFLMRMRVGEFKTVFTFVVV
jgi:beta-glucosidase-like glycosyl hydrolase